jgi:hypothetical protein
VLAAAPYLGGFNPGGVDPTSTIHLATTEPRNYSGYSNPGST